MKVIIDIPKKTFEQNKFLIDQGFGTIIDEYVSQGKVISDMTNGDILKMMFPSDANELNMSKLHLMYDGLDYIHEFRKDWWNSPYKAEVEE